MIRRAFILALAAALLAATPAGPAPTGARCGTDTECQRLFGGDGGPSPLP